MVKFSIPYNESNQVIINKTIDINKTILESINNTINLSDPSIVITTWDNINLLVMIVGGICFVTGYLIAKLDEQLKNRRRKRGRGSLKKIKEEDR